MAGGAGYSDRAEFNVWFNVDIGAAQFTLINVRVAYKINMYVNLNPTTDVGTDFTVLAKMISDEMITIGWNYLKESSMENPPEFIHYKLPHFTPMQLEMLNDIKTLLGHVGDAGDGN